MARRAQIVVMEEDRNDARFLKQTFAKSAMGVPVRFVCDGRQAIKAMEGQGLGEHGLRLPTLVLLDLKVPVEQGFEVLAWLQSNERQCVAEAVVLSGLRRQEDIERAYRLGASSYLVKPRDENGFRTLVHALTTFWLENQFSGWGDRSLPCGPPGGRLRVEGPDRLHLKPEVRRRAEVLNRNPEKARSGECQPSTGAEARARGMRTLEKCRT